MQGLHFFINFLKASSSVNHETFVDNYVGTGHKIPVHARGSAFGKAVSQCTSGHSGGNIFGAFQVRKMCHLFIGPSA